MEPNPYKSPQSGSFQDSPPRVQDQDPTQLLAEIRDIQRELLDLNRQAVAKQKKMFRFLLVVVAFLLLVTLVVFGNVLYAIRSLPQRPGPGTQPVYSLP